MGVGRLHLLGPGGPDPKSDDFCFKWEYVSWSLPLLGLSFSDSGTLKVLESVLNSKILVATQRGGQRGDGVTLSSNVGDPITLDRKVGSGNLKQFLVEESALYKMICRIALGDTPIPRYEGPNLVEITSVQKVTKSCKCHRI